MNSLRIRRLHISSTVLLDVCKTLSHLTVLNLAGVFRDSSYDEVLKAISTSMPQLKTLDITDAKVSPSAIIYLLPTEGPPRRGCPNLKAINLLKIKCIDVTLLKKIIMSLPKLQYVGHLLMVSVLPELTDEEAQTSSNYFNCLDQLRVPSLSDDSTKIRYDILQNAPKFAMKCNISKVSLFAKGHTKFSLADLLMPLAKLESVILENLSNCHMESLLAVLESKGHQLRNLHLCEVSQFVSLHDIVRTCLSLRRLTMNYSVDYDFGKNQEKQPVESVDLPSLNDLEFITLAHLNKQMCTSEMLDALLVSPSQSNINLTAIETLSTDSMLNLLSCSLLGSPALTSVRNFQVNKCQNITAAPFVRLLSMDDTKLDELHIEDCDMVDKDVLHQAVKSYQRPLDITVRSSTKVNSQEI